MTEKRLDQNDIEHLKLSRAIEAMVATEGWKLYKAILSGHLQQQMAKVLQPSSDMNGMVARESAVGAAMAFKLATELPDGIIAVAKDIRERHGGGHEVE